MKKFLAGALTCFVVMGILIIRFYPGPKTIIEYKYRDKIKTVYSYIKGETIILPSDPSTGSGNDPPGASWDFKAAVPTDGKIVTDYVEIAFTGTTYVERKGDRLTVNTEFNPDVTEVLKMPAEPFKHWDIYAGLKTNFRETVPIVGIEYEKKLFWRFSGSISGEWDNQGDGEYKALTHYKF